YKLNKFCIGNSINQAKMGGFIFVLGVIVHILEIHIDDLLHGDIVLEENSGHFVANRNRHTNSPIHPPLDVPETKSVFKCSSFSIVCTVLFEFTCCDCKPESGNLMPLSSQSELLVTFSLC